MSKYINGKNATPLVAIEITDENGNEHIGYYQSCSVCHQAVISGLELEGTAYCDEDCLKNDGYNEEEIEELWDRYDDFDDCPLFFTDWIGMYTEKDYNDFLNLK